MATAPRAETRNPRNPVLIVVCVVFAAALVAAVIYLSRAPVRPAVNGPASSEAKAYLPNLALSDVKMQASENFMQQQVVEITGQITNKGPRPLESVEVYCIFYGVNGREVYRERQAIVNSKGGPLERGQTRAFRLPFDSLPDGWNQALPHLVIASIHFAK